jgi:hypothetical protein
LKHLQLHHPVHTNTQNQEQKLYDIAGCLADVLRCTAGDTSAAHYEGKHYLNILLHQLSNIRGKESHYLRPLLAKMDGLIGFDMSQSLPLPTDSNSSVFPSPLPQINVTTDVPLGVQGGFPMGPATATAGRGLSVSQNGMEMLRTLSLSGAGLMMPNLNLPLNLSAPMGEAVAQEVSWGRRPSGRVYDEEETSWLMDDRAG